MGTLKFIVALLVDVPYVEAKSFLLPGVAEPDSVRHLGVVDFEVAMIAIDHGIIFSVSVKDLNRHVPIEPHFSAKANGY
jgi:hypothetical protein